MCIITLNMKLYVHAWGADCLIAKVDGLGKVDLPYIFGKFAPPILIYFVNTFMYIFVFLGHIIDSL